jgi:integrase
VWRSGLRQRSFHKIIAAANLPRIRPHDLRHLHATLMDQAGVTPKVASSRLGHAKVDLTQNVYTHAQKVSDLDVAAKVHKLLFL